MIPSVIVFVHRGVCSLNRFMFKFGKYFSAKILISVTRAKKFQLAFTALVFILLAFYGYSKLNNTGNIKVLTVEKRNLQDYCNFPVNTYTNSAEGLIPGKDADLHLEMVQVIIRHGDRAPYRMLQGMEVKDLDCSMQPKNKSLKELFTRYIKIVDDITVKKMSPNVVSHNLVSQSNICVYKGQMTQKGFQQHFEIGRHLRNAYRKLITMNEINSKSIYARSTNTDRTAQSVSALLYGLLDEKTIKKGHITIGVSKDIFFRENDEGVVKLCPSYKKIMEKTKKSKEFKDGHTTMEPLILEMSKLLNIPREFSVPQSVKALADFCHVHFCHGLNWPCAKGGCISKAEAFKLISYADWTFSHNFSQVAADMVSLPILTQIASRMVDKTASKTSTIFATYGGHENSIIPVLISLGTYEGRWIPYASRLVFEFWRKSSISNETKKPERQFIRILFNGKSVTQNLTFCKENLVHNGELCPLEEFLGWLGGGKFEETQERYEKMCNQ